MRLCVVDSKECWQTLDGRWVSDGGFPLQIGALRSLFDAITLVVLRGRPRSGGMPLPEDARIVALERPRGGDFGRKLSVLARLPQYLPAIARQMRDADVVHVPLPGDITFLGMAVALALRKPLIARYGGSWRPTSETTLMNRFTRACMRRLAGGRNLMVATGEPDDATAPALHWIFVTALSAQEVAQIRPRLDRAFSSPPRLAYVGRLSPEKGVRYLIQALACLRRADFTPMPRLTIVGDGPEREVLVDLASALGCRDSIEFVGQLTRSELSDTLQQVDLCVQPSLTEGFSKAWLDAMVHGLPVIATRVGAAHSLIGGAGERGWIVSPGDAEALSQTIRRALTVEIDWPALRTRCRAYAESRTLEQWAQQIGAMCAAKWNLSLVDGKLRV